MLLIGIKNCLGWPDPEKLGIFVVDDVRYIPRVPTDLEMLYKSCRANEWGQPVEIGLDPDQGIPQWSPEKEKKNSEISL